MLKREKQKYTYLMFQLLKGSFLFGLFFFYYYSPLPGCFYIQLKKHMVIKFYGGCCRDKGINKTSVILPSISCLYAEDKHDLQKESCNTINVLCLMFKQLIEKSRGFFKPIILHSFLCIKQFL